MILIQPPFVIFKDHLLMVPCLGAETVQCSYRALALSVENKQSGLDQVTLHCFGQSATRAVCARAKDNRGEWRGDEGKMVSESKRRKI